MQKDKVIFIVIIGLLVGFVAGAIAGINFSSKGSQKPAAEMAPQGAAKIVPNEEIAALENVLKKDPGNLNTLIALGNLYFDAQQSRKAVEMYGRALLIDPKNADVRTDMAIMHRSLKDFDGAIRELKLAAAQDPNHANSRYNLGIILLHDKSDLKGAAAAWEDFLKVEPMGSRAEGIRKRLEQLRAMAK